MPDNVRVRIIVCGPIVEGKVLRLVSIAGVCVPYPSGSIVPDISRVEVNPFAHPVLYSVSLQHVDYENSCVFGYLKIQGLTEVCLQL